MPVLVVAALLVHYLVILPLRAAIEKAKISFANQNMPTLVRPRGLLHG
jgi:hypothetical protein